MHRQATVAPPVPGASHAYCMSEQSPRQALTGHPSVTAPALLYLLHPCSRGLLRLISLATVTTLSILPRGCQLQLRSS
ncbi:MAG: hypothetical protein GY820_42870 [Gammaproteobacteria bacterium]|nr:hypothetical protein [Gammaproteobacteria bacterium]